MAGGSTITAIEFGSDRMHAAQLSIGQGKVEVQRTVIASRPSDLTTAEAIGVWASKVLRDGGIKAKSIVFVARRDEVVLKRLAVPAGAGLQPQELAGLVRLAISRQVTLAMDGAGIDYVPLREVGATEELPVIAAAMPADRVGWYKGVGAAMGVKKLSIDLSSFGIAALIADVAARRGGSALAIAIQEGSAELVAIEDGQIVLSRSVDAVAPVAEEEREGYAARLAVEARRTWMGVRAGQDAGSLEIVGVLGADALAELVRARCADSAVASASEVIRTPAAVEWSESTTPEQMRALMPLVGVGLRRALQLEGVDFLMPRKGKDRGARKRELVLATVFMLIIGLGGLWVVAQQRLGELRESRALAMDRAQKLSTQYAELLVQEARANSIEQWSSAGFDWLSHLRWLSDQMPEPSSGLLDEIKASMSADVQVTLRDRTTSNATWTTQQRAVFSIAGQVVRRDVALELRGRLVNGDVYSVLNQSADTADRFGFELVTARRSPFDAIPSGAGASKGGSK
jgi:hypothetical protein